MKMTYLFNLTAMNFDRVTNPMMKAFFVKLSHQIEKSDIPEGTTMPVAVDLPPEEPEEVIKLKEEIESMKSQLEKKNDSIQSLLSQINEHKIANKNLEKKVADLDFSYEVLEAEKNCLQTKNESLEEELEEAKAAIKPGLISVQDLMNEAHTLDRASRLNLITSLERLLAHQSGDIDKILESERNSLNVEIKDEDYSQDEDGRSVFVVIKTLDKIFKKLGIVQKADNLKLARLYAYISGYKYTTIKNRLPVDDDIPERSKDEVRTVQKLLNDVNSGISMN